MKRKIQILVALVLFVVSIALIGCSNSELKQIIASTNDNTDNLDLNSDMIYTVIDVRELTWSNINNSSKGKLEVHLIIEDEEGNRQLITTTSTGMNNNPSISSLQRSIIVLSKNDKVKYVNGVFVLTY